MEAAEQNKLIEQHPILADLKKQRDRLDQSGQSYHGRRACQITSWNGRY